MAEEWLEAPSKTARARVFARTGIRWSEMLRLPYWDPTRSVVVDAMHNLFLGLVQFHIRKVLQIEGTVSPDDDEWSPAATPDEMAKARQVWADGLKKPNDLKKVKKPALLGLCTELGIILPKPEGGKHRRSDLVQALIVSLP